MISNIVITSIITGGVYALLASGFSLIFGVARIMNMAHTAFYMICGVLLFILGVKLHQPIFLSVPLAILITIVVAMACYKLFFDRVKEHITAVILISAALALLFQEVFLLGLTGQYQRVPSFIAGSVTCAGIKTTYQHVIAACVSIITLFALWCLLTKTRLGIAIRAVAEDSEIANVMGINVSLINMITMGISAALAGIAAVVVAPIYMVYPLMWIQPLTIVLAAVVLGGLGSVKGAVIAAYVIAFVEVSVTSLIPGGSFLKGAAAMSAMVIILFVKPEGLFGVVFEEERL
ncbi:MAG: branched-chain amino acid ABC transporter permease [Deltaproteobacteria bacterium]|nr:branched-chain amino acid ABC transporter permease [Deltaproteobacteria bacterium]